MRVLDDDIRATFLPERFGTATAPHGGSAGRPEMPKNRFFPTEESSPFRTGRRSKTSADADVLEVAAARTEACIGVLLAVTAVDTLVEGGTLRL